MKETIRRMFGLGKPEKPKDKEKAMPPASAASAPKKSMENFLNPREVNARREREAGLAKGGKVKAYAKGGSVKGCGIAMRGKTKAKMYR